MVLYQGYFAAERLEIVIVLLFFLMGIVFLFGEEFILCFC